MAIALAVIAALVIIGGFYLSKGADRENAMMKETERDAMVEQGDAMMEEGSDTMEEDEMMEDSGDTMMEKTEDVMMER